MLGTQVAPLRLQSTGGMLRIRESSWKGSFSEEQPLSFSLVQRWENYFPPLFKRPEISPLSHTPRAPNLGKCTQETQVSLILEMLRVYFLSPLINQNNQNKARLVSKITTTTTTTKNLGNMPHRILSDVQLHICILLTGDKYYELYYN